MPVSKVNKKHLPGFYRNNEKYIVGEEGATKNFEGSHRPPLSGMLVFFRMDVRNQLFCTFMENFEEIIFKYTLSNTHESQLKVPRTGLYSRRTFNLIV